MTNLYTYAALIINKSNEKEIMDRVRTVAENDLISSCTRSLHRKAIHELRKMSENLLADRLEKDYPHKL